MKWMLWFIIMSPNDNLSDFILYQSKEECHEALKVAEAQLSQINLDAVQIRYGCALQPL